MLTNADMGGHYYNTTFLLVQQKCGQQGGTRLRFISKQDAKKLYN